MPSFAEMIGQNAMKSVADARDPNAGSGVAQGMQVGAQLAIEQQKNQMAQQQLQQKQMELRNAQVDKVYNFIQGAHNYQNASDRNNYLKNVPAMAAALGLPPNAIPQEALTGMGSDENMGRIAAINAQVEGGQLKPAQALQIMGDKQALSQVTPLPPEAINLGKMATTDAFKDFMTRQNAKEVAGIKAGAGVSFDKTLDSLGKEARSSFGKLNTEQTAMSSALDAKDRIAASLKSDPSGRTASPVDMGAMIYSLLHSELGRVNHTELDNQLKIPGIENMTQDQIVKYLGGVNPNTFKFLSDRLDTAAKNIDTEVSDKAKSFRTQIDARDNLSAAQKMQLHNVINPLAKTVSRGGGGGMVTFGNRPVSRAVLEAYVNDPKHAQNPDYADAKAALGVK